MVKMMFAAVVTLSLLCTHLTLGQRPPHPDVEFEDYGEMEVEVDQSVTFKCLVKNYLGLMTPRFPPIPVEIVRDMEHQFEERVLSSFDKVFEQQDRYRVTVQNRSSTLEVKFTIDPVRREDSGMYRCRVGQHPHRFSSEEEKTVIELKVSDFGERRGDRQEQHMIPKAAVIAIPVVGAVILIVVIVVVFWMVKVRRARGQVVGEKGVVATYPLSFVETDKDCKKTPILDFVNSGSNLYTTPGSNLYTTPGFNQYPPAYGTENEKAGVPPPYYGMAVGPSAPVYTTAAAMSPAQVEALAPPPYPTKELSM
ncbi:uncharacterized protein LOC131934852 [Physella acuta]|uniref:uncharacterized protein LOC131934852 n=1 Tax=Physella acuta TaxID=109671 RepID=UPI0027DDCF7C|nr:uncharacterized protein LOC131934852 [Physella acuta]